MMILSIFILILFANVTLNYESDFACSLCRLLASELNYQVSLIDPSQKIEKGSYRLSAKGDTNTKMIQFSRSDTFLTTAIDLLCKEMNKYGQLWTNNIPQFVRFEPHNAEQYDVSGVYKDENVTLWLKNKCDEFIDDNEDQLKSEFMNTEPGEKFLWRIQNHLCVEELDICTSDHMKIKDELEYIDVENLDSNVDYDDDDEDEDDEEDGEDKEDHGNGVKSLDNGLKENYDPENNSAHINYNSKDEYSEEDYEYGSDNPENFITDSTKMKQKQNN